LLNPLDYLKKARLSYSEMRDDRPLKQLISSFDEDEALRRAQHRYSKWMRKRGKQLGNSLTQSMRARVSYGFIRQAFLEVVLSKVLGSYGVTGGRFIDYSGLGYAVAKKAESYSGSSLVGEVNKLLQRYKLEREVEDEIAHVVALVCAKVAFYVRRKYRNTILSEAEEVSVEPEEAAKRMVEDLKKRLAEAHEAQKEAEGEKPEEQS